MSSKPFEKHGDGVSKAYSDLWRLFGCRPSNFGEIDDAIHAYRKERLPLTYDTWSIRRDDVENALSSIDQGLEIPNGWATLTKEVELAFGPQISPIQVSQSLEAYLRRDWPPRDIAQVARLTWHMLLVAEGIRDPAPRGKYGQAIPNWIVPIHNRFLDVLIAADHRYENETLRKALSLCDRYQHDFLCGGPITDATIQFELARDTGGMRQNEGWILRVAERMWREALESPKLLHRAAQSFGLVAEEINSAINEFKKDVLLLALSGEYVTTKLPSLLDAYGGRLHKLDPKRWEILWKKVNELAVET